MYTGDTCAKQQVQIARDSLWLIVHVCIYPVYDDETSSCVTTGHRLGVVSALQPQWAVDALRAFAHVNCSRIQVTHIEVAAFRGCGARLLV